LTQTLVDLGSTPLANSYLTASQLSEVELSYPLHARVCDKCRLVQVENVVTASDIFSHYAYFSSYSKAWIEHARQFTEMAIDRWHITTDSKVVEIASNDGYLLQHFVQKHIPVLGIEPAENVAKIAIDKNIPTEVAFFGKELATRLAESGKADLLIGNNVFAHVPDINDFVAGCKNLLQENGVISLEFPHLLALIQHGQFDTIYHEHFSYISLHAAEKIFAAHGLRIFDVTELPTHGGSLRIMACHRTASHAECAGLLQLRHKELDAEFDSGTGYEGFAEKVAVLKKNLLSFLSTARQENKTIVAFGAAAKGNTFLNYCGIDTTSIQYVVDETPFKQGLFLPGSHLPIHPLAKLYETKPDYVLILPWNWRAEIVNKLADVRSWGGKFVVAAPALEIF
jgi:SAM-dependent methyltransferase